MLNVEFHRLTLQAYPNITPLRWASYFASEYIFLENTPARFLRSITNHWVIIQLLLWIMIVGHKLQALQKGLDLVDLKRLKSNVSLLSLIESFKPFLTSDHTQHHCWVRSKMCSVAPVTTPNTDVTVQGVYLYVTAVRCNCNCNWNCKFLFGEVSIYLSI